MSGTPSKKKRDEDHNEATVVAWTEPKNSKVQKARRVKVWLKHSVTTLTSPTSIEFEGQSPPSRSRRRRDPARQPLRHHQNQQQQQQHQQQFANSNHLRPSSTTTSRKTTATIDQAMFSLYTYTGPKKKLQGTSVVPVEPETPSSSYVPTYDYDWFLDGKDDWQQDDQTSLEYIQQLNEPWDMASYLDTYLQQREEQFHCELKADEEAFQFDANFDPEVVVRAPPVASDKTNSQAINAKADTEEENFGDFQEPPTPGSAVEEKANYSSSEEDDDFGDFQAAHPDDNHMQAGEVIDNELKTPSLLQEYHAEPEKRLTETNSKDEAQQQEEEESQKVPIPELSNQHNDSDDVSSLGCYGSVDVDDEDEEEDECKYVQEMDSSKTPKEQEANHNHNNESDIDVVESSPTEKIPPIISCNSNDNNMPIMSPGSIGDSIFACSYQNEELESSEEEIVAEAVNILKSVQSSAEDTPCQGDRPPSIQIEQESKSEARSEDQEASDKNEEKTSGKSIHSIDDAAEVNSDSTSSHPARESSDAIRILGGDTDFEGTENDGEDDDFGDFCEAEPVSKAIDDPLGEIAFGDFGDFQDPAQMVDDILVSSSSSHSTAGNDNRAAPPSNMASAAAAAAQSFTPTFAVLPPLKMDAAVKTRQEASTSFQTSQPQPLSGAELFQDQSSFPADQESSTLDDSDIFSVTSDASFTANCPVSLRLPITDLSSLEARFARRRWVKHNRSIHMNQGHDRQSESTLTATLADDEFDINGEPQCSISDLDIPHYYFTQPDLDDTTRVLQNAPWHHIAHLWQDEKDDDESLRLRIASSYSFEDQLDRRELWEEYLTDELCHLDAAQNEVSKHLLRKIRPHEPTLKVANRSIHEFATNLHLAQMYLKRSQASVRQAARGPYDTKRQQFKPNSGWHGAHELLQAWDQQELFRDFQKTLNKIQDILDTEKSLRKSVENFAVKTENPLEYSNLIRQVQQLKTAVFSSNAWVRLDALADLRSRLKEHFLMIKFRDRLHVLADSVAVRCCRRRHVVVWDEYRILLEAVLQVDETVLSPPEKEAIEPSDSNEKMSPSVPGENDDPLTATWPRTILKALCYEADRALAAALLDPLLVPDNADFTVDSEYERELTQLACELQQDWGDAAKLRTVTHNLVIIRFDWESSNRYFLPVYHRLCLILSDVLYAHHMFGQWHERFVTEYESAHCGNGEEDSKEEKSETAVESGENGISGIEKSKQSRCLKMLQKIRSNWLENQEILWKRCEDVVIKCLDEYLHFASHQNLFQKQKQAPAKRNSDDSLDESSHSTSTRDSEDNHWRNDLEELHSVLALTKQFMSVRNQFLGNQTGYDKSVPFCNDLREKLCDVFRKNLRHVHVEAMKSLGMSLSQESWALHSCKHLDYENSTSVSLQELLASGVAKATETVDGQGDIQSLNASSGNLRPQSRRRGAPPRATRSLYSKASKASANPFLVCDSDFKGAEEKHDETNIVLPQDSTEPVRDLYKLIDEVLAGGDPASSFSRVASDSTLKVVFVWVARLLLIMERLPLIVEDVSAVFANLCDLYFTTVFRLCAGNATNERLLLGVDSPALPILDSNSFAPKSPDKSRPPTSPPLFGFRRRASSGSINSGRRKSTLSKVEIPTTLEADVCAPVRSEISELNSTRAFIQRAQKSLKDIVILDKVDHWINDPAIVGASPEDSDKILEKAIRNQELRLGAAWSCLSIAALLDATCKVARKKLSNNDLGRHFVEDLSTLEHYTLAVFKMAPQLVRLSSRISCVRAILAKRVVLEILKVGTGWEEAKLNEHPNDYIEALCSRCTSIWASLTTSKTKLPAGVLKVTWEDIVRGGFVSLLEGMSKVPYCSTEGRALMSMDLASFAAGVNPTSVMERLDYDSQYEAPPSVAPRQGMGYLDTYIKVFYYPREDVMEWIRENYGNYHLNHCLTLAANAFRAPDSSGIPVEVALEAVKNIYHRQDMSSSSSEEDAEDN